MNSSSEMKRREYNRRYYENRRRAEGKPAVKPATAALQKPKGASWSRRRLDLTPEQRAQRTRDQKRRYRTRRISTPEWRAVRRRYDATQRARLDATIGPEQRIERRRAYLRARMDRIRADPELYRAFREKEDQRKRAFTERLKRHEPKKWAAYIKTAAYVASLKRADPKRYVEIMEARARAKPRVQAYRRMLWQRIKADPVAHAARSARQRATYQAIMADPARAEERRTYHRAYMRRRNAIRKLHDPRNALSTHAQIKARIPKAVHPELREDLVQELFAAILVGELRLEQIDDRNAIKPYLARVRKLMPDVRRQFSLDTVIR